MHQPGSRVEVFGLKNRVHLRVPTSDLHITIHVKYIASYKMSQNRQDAINKLIKDKYILCPGVGFSSSTSLIMKEI